jgi:ribosomal protein L29
LQKRNLRRQIARLNTLVHQQEKTQAVEKLKAGAQA